MIQKYFLDNNHKAFVMVEPKKGLTKEIEDKVREKLAAYKESLSEEEKEAIIKNAEALRIYQDEPSRKEDVEKIPLLSIDDIEKKADPIVYEKLDAAGAPVIYVNEFTNGIAYLRMAFSLKEIPFDMLPYAAMLANVYRLVDTDNFTYQELTTEINLNMGGWGTDTEILPLREEAGSYLGLFEVSAKGLYEQLPNLFDMTKEIIFKSHVTDKERLREIISQMKTNLQQRNSQAGHAASANRALSYFSKSALAKEKMDGIDFYEFIKDLEENFEEKYDSLAAGLLKVREMIFAKKNLMISYTADEMPLEILTKEVEGLYEVFYEAADGCEVNGEESDAVPVVKNEGFKTSSKVQYNAKAGNFVTKGFQYHGALKALHMMFSYDYLWQNIRVKGGAYGCMCGFTRLGNAYFTSYRDPNLSATLDVYKNAWEYVANFDADDRDMTKYIIGAIGNMDAPIDPSAKGMQMFRAWLMGVTTELIQKERDELLTCTQETIRSLAPLVKAAFEDNIICVIGNENKLEEEKELFKEVRSIF